MKSIFKLRIFILTLAAALVLSCAGPAARQSGASYHKFYILNTTDEHQYIMPYNYMADKPAENMGLSKIYTLVKEIRAQNPNTLLLSAGDIIQGSLIGEMESQIEALAADEYQTIIKVLNYMGYEAAAVGNHDVTDFGLEFFERARANSDFEWVSANIKKAANENEFYIKPYVILEKEIDGLPVKIGVIGFTPPQITNWGRRHLEGKLVTKDIIPQAQKYIAELREKCDVLIVAAHTGITLAPVNSDAARENAGYYLSLIEGVDAMALGHRHAEFPGGFDDMEGIDNEKGLINGVPATLARSWGRALGVIELNLRHENGKWEVLGGSSKLRHITDDIASSPEIENIAKSVHAKTASYVRTPLGKTKMPIASYFSRIKDTAITQLINEAQLWYARRELKGTEYENLPVLSAAAAFIAGREGPDYFTSVSGEINIGDVTDMYIYPNTIKIVKINGAQLIDFLEHSAKNFNQIDPLLSSPQHIVNYERRAFNYDVVEGVEYEFDITRPEGSRVVSASYNGKPLDKKMEFAIVMNNYRADGGGDFPHMLPENIILEATDINREIIINYIREKGEVHPAPSGNWKIKKIYAQGPLLFRTSPNAAEYLKNRDIKNISIEHMENDADGWAVFRIKF